LGKKPDRPDLKKLCIAESRLIREIAVLFVYTKETVARMLKERAVAS
jgi:hypothetical protein